VVPKIDFVTWCESFVSLRNPMNGKVERVHFGGQMLKVADLPKEVRNRYQDKDEVAWQRAILDEALKYDKDGRFAYQTIVYSCPKKSGKTAINALLMGYWAFNIESPNELITVANKRDQAVSRGYREMVEFIKRHPVLSNEVVSRTNTKMVLRNGTSILAIPNDFSGEAGSNHGLTTWDELWGFCLTPETKVLRGDLVWVYGDDLRVGDNVLSFDDERVGPYRSFKKGTVTSTGRKKLPVMKIVLSNGKVFNATPQHRWLIKRKKHNEVIWMETCNLKQGDKLMKVIDPWETVKDYDAGYLAGALDGEGSLSQVENKGWRIDFAQRDNPMREKVKSILDDFGYKYFDTYRDRTCKQYSVGSKHEVLKILGEIRPKRLLDKLNLDALGRMTAKEYVDVVSVKHAGNSDVVTLSIDAGTFLADGYASHNTTERDMRLWDELTPVPTRLNSIRFISTYAGFTGESALLEGLYYKIFDPQHMVKPGIKRPLGKDVPVYVLEEDRLFVYWDNTPRMPWQDEEYYAGQRATLRDSAYVRLHENRWVSSETGLFDMEKWDACVDDSHAPPLPDKTITLFIGVDIGTKRDRSAVVSVYRDGNRLRLGPKRFWQPTVDNPIDLEETVEAYILSLSRQYQVAVVRYDPYQFHRSATTLTKRGITMQEYPQTTSNLQIMGQNIYDMIEYKQIVLYNDTDLRFEANCARAKEAMRGLQITKEKSTQKIDQIVALAMACVDVKSGFFRNCDLSGVPINGS
jgi:hypothetical protein